MLEWSQDQYTKYNVSEVERKEKDTLKPYYIPQSALSY